MTNINKFSISIKSNTPSETALKNFRKKLREIFQKKRAKD